MSCSHSRSSHFVQKSEQNETSDTSAVIASISHDQQAALSINYLIIGPSSINDESLTSYTTLMTLLHQGTHQDLSALWATIPSMGPDKIININLPLFINKQSQFIVSLRDSDEFMIVMQDSNIVSMHKIPPPSKEDLQRRADSRKRLHMLIEAEKKRREQSPPETSQ